jgi:hypothetical protein
MQGAALSIAMVDLTGKLLAMFHDFSSVRSSTTCKLYTCGESAFGDRHWRGAAISQALQAQENGVVGARQVLYKPDDR